MWLNWLECRPVHQGGLGCEDLNQYSGWLTGLSVAGFSSHRLPLKEGRLLTGCSNICNRREGESA